jgi:hypothetical protein
MHCKIQDSRTILTSKSVQRIKGKDPREARMKSNSQQNILESLIFQLQIRLWMMIERRLKREVQYLSMLTQRISQGMISNYRV